MRLRVERAGSSTKPGGFSPRPAGKPHRFSTVELIRAIAEIERGG